MGRKKVSQRKTFTWPNTHVCDPQVASANRVDDHVYELLRCVSPSCNKVRTRIIELEEE